jgi:ribosomal protein S21
MRVRCILKEGETIQSLLKRFNQRVQKSGLLKEVTKNRFRGKKTK